MRYCLILLTLLLLIGCKRGPSLVGNWTGQAHGQLGSHPQEVTFREDGTFQIVTRLINGAKGIITNDTGTWKLDGDKLTYVLTDVNWETTGLDAAAASRIKQRVQATKAQIISDANAAGTVTIRWVDNDKFIETNPQGETVYTRVQ